VADRLLLPGVLGVCHRLTRLGVSKSGCCFKIIILLTIKDTVHRSLSPRLDPAPIADAWQRRRIEPLRNPSTCPPLSRPASSGGSKAELSRLPLQFVVTAFPVNVQATVAPAHCEVAPSALSFPQVPPNPFPPAGGSGPRQSGPLRALRIPQIVTEHQIIEKAPETSAGSATARWRPFQGPSPPSHPSRTTALRCVGGPATHQPLECRNFPWDWEQEWRWGVQCQRER